MPLFEDLEHDGNWLFRWRSYLPLALLPFIVVGIADNVSSGHVHSIPELRREMRWEMLCLTVTLVGLVIRVMAIGWAAPKTSGRGMRRQRANSLNTTGLYSVVRHPLYLGNFFVAIGLFMLPAIWWIVLVYVLSFWLYYERIIFAEEEFLRRKFGDVFIDWARGRPALVPKIQCWKTPERPFDLRRVFKSEYRTLFGIVVVYAFFDLGENWLIEQQPRVEPAWQIIFAIAGAMFVAGRLLPKRKSSLPALLIAAIAGLPAATSAQSPPDRQAAPKVVQELSAAFRAAVERVRPSVVFIETHGGPRKLVEWSKHQSQANNGPIRNPETDPEDGLHDALRDGSGTGIIFDDRGYVLTCYHVVESADIVFVRLADGRRFESTKVLTDPLTDLAVVQIADAGPLSPATLADSDELRVGDWVVSIGNPYSLGLSVSAGIVSATDRHSPLVPRALLIQTDAASNPGNSGGALINLEGEVVGISEGGYGAHEGFQGIGFAVPINVAKRIARQLIDDGRVSRVALGCETETMSGGVAKHLGLTDKSGVIVTGVQSQSPAFQGDLRIGDVITHFEGARLQDNAELLKLLERAVPGRDITFTVFRENRQIEIVVRPDELPKHRENERPAVNENPKQPPGYHDVRLGLALDEMSADLAAELGYSAGFDGLVVTYVRPDSPVAKQGLCAGMIVLRIDNEPVRNLEDYKRVTENRSSDQESLMLIGAPNRKHFIVVRK